MANSIAMMTVEHDAPPETRLWRAVIASTIEEWVSGPLRRQREAEQYLFGDNSDFLQVCQSAGMDPVYLRQRLSKMRGQLEAHINSQIAA